MLHWKIKWSCDSYGGFICEVIPYIKLLHTNCYHVNIFTICLQETWITNITDLSAFQINGYTLIAQEAQCSSHEGLAIFIKQNLKY